MGDGLKLTKDKRHKSSSSLAGVAIEGTRSERKLDIRASIPEVDDQFTLAEARCDDLQEKIDLVKDLKRKRKLKKRSMTRLSESPAIQDVPFISVRAQPKKRVSHQAARLRQLEAPQNPTRGYVDPARVEQHRMLGQVRANQMYREPSHEEARNKQPVTDPQQAKSRYRRDRADGDFMLGEGSHHQEVACLAVENGCIDPINMNYDRSQSKRTTDTKKSTNSRLQNNQKTSSKKQFGNMPQSEAAKWKDSLEDTRRPTNTMAGSRRQQRPSKETTSNEIPYKLERSSIVELFTKERNLQKTEIQSRSDQREDTIFEKTKKRATKHQTMEDNKTINPVESSTSQITKEKSMHRHPRRLKYRSRRYELPTVSSQMKQAGARYYCGSYNQSTIPFIVSKSTAPSHNIGVNIQQVLNGIKIQQPLSGIPFTIAHHMGLGHLPYNSKNMTQPSLDHREMNVIRLGGRLVRLPSYKYMSYNRLLSLYRESDGMVSRFLRAMSRPHYLYNSMYNAFDLNHSLATREDYDGATSKGHVAAHDAKQSLAEYASLYREYEQLEKHIKDGSYDPELERRREELARELTAREDHIRKVMQEYRAGEGEPSALRGSASTAGDNYRHSTFKLNLADAHL